MTTSIDAMSNKFKTTLFEALGAATDIHVDGYMASEPYWCWNGTDRCRLKVKELDRPSPEFNDQEIEINAWDGTTTAINHDGEPYDLTFFITAPLQPEDIPVKKKETSASTADIQSANIKIVIDVKYDLNGMSPEEIQAFVRKECERAIGNGMLSGYTDATVDDWKLSTEIISTS